jgi:(p)ppGpp synthase/HD superfamily hydrolase
MESMENLLERAIEIAARAHSGQQDKAGAPYILHPLRVMLGVDCGFERMAAILHDVAEDCPEWPLDAIADEGFPPIVVLALDALTRREGEAYGDFIERVGKNPVATRVKIADLRDNMDLSRFSEPTKADVERVRTRYAPALAKLLALHNTKENG